MVPKLLTLFLLLILMGSLVGCSREARTEDVDKAADVFFERLRTAQYDAVYDDAAPRFKDQNARAVTLDNLKQIVAIGRIMKHTRLSMTFGKESDGRTSSPEYAVIFDTSRAAITLTFLDSGGDWKLLGFAVKQRGG